MHDTTVVIPARNAGRTLARCLTALAASEGAPFEVLVVDDGLSTDETAQVAARHGATLVPLAERAGPGGARNAGVARASTDLIAFVDADVAARGDAISRLVSAVRADPSVAAAFGSYDDQPAETNLASQYKNLLHHFVHQRSRVDAQTFWAGLGAVRRSAFDQVGGFDAARYSRPGVEDIELGQRLCAAGFRIVLVKEAQGSHLKRWTAGRVFRSDLFDRAAPWTQLILAAPRMPNDLNLTLRHRLGVIFTAMLLLSLVAGAFDRRFLVVGAASLAATLIAAGDVLRFLAQRRGLGFAIRATPLHFGYYLACGLGFTVGTLRYAMARTKTARRRAGSPPGRLPFRHSP